MDLKTHPQNADGPWGVHLSANPSSTEFDKSIEASRDQPTQTNRQTNRQTDRQTVRQTDREKEKEK